MHFSRKIKYYFKAFPELTKRNRANYNDVRLNNNIYLYYYRLSDDCGIEGKENIGDYLSTVVIPHFVPRTINNNNQNKKTLYGIGSILGFRCQDSIVWGSGILNEDDRYLIRIKWSKQDIRAVRGPKTRDTLIRLGKKCPAIYGDPAILMPFIYQPPKLDTIYPVSIIFNYGHKSFIIPNEQEINTIDIVTSDYKFFINQIIKSKLIISSSLHGIIIAETYGVPAICLLDEKQSTYKYEDWYLSTGRSDIVIARSIEEALQLKPMPLPNLTDLQNNLIKAFPYDLWSEKT